MEKDFITYYDSVRSPVFQLLPPHASRILDIGGGTGATAIAAKGHLSAKIAGVIDVEPIAPSKRRPGLDFWQQGDVESSNVLEQIGRQFGPFDLVLCLDVLEHLIDPWLAIQRIDHILVPDGYVVASIPNARHFSASLRLLFGTWDYRPSGILDQTHLRFFVKKTAIKLVTCSGMRLERIESTRSPNFQRLQTVGNMLTAGLLREFFEWQYLIRVRKTGELSSLMA